MNNTDIETFWAVVEHGSMTAAADALFITQPTLSSRVQSLEKEVGARLFIRGKGVKRVRLTEAGQNFLPLARRWQALLTETDYFAAAKRQEYLHIAAVYTANRYILPPVYQRFVEREPRISLWVETMPAHDAANAVAQGNCDFAIVDSRQDYDLRLDARPLFREPFLLGTARDNDAIPPRVHPSQLRPADEILVSRQPEIEQWHGHWFGADAPPALRTDIAEAMPTCGRRWSIIPASAANAFRRQYRWKICRLTDPPADRLFYLVTRRAAVEAEAGRTFIESLREELERLKSVTFLL